MSSIPSAAGRSLRDFHQARAAVTRLGQQLITGKEIQKPQDGPAKWLAASRAQSTITYLDAIHTGLNEVATTIRVAATTMQAIAEHLATMQGQLEQASRYPAGNPIRQQLIASSNATRRQIDDLVNTTLQTGARNLMSDPAGNAQAGDIHVLVGLNGECETVHGEQVDTGPGGLNLANLPVNATDTEIQNALQDLRSARTILEERQQGLAADAADIARYTGRDASISRLYQSQAEAGTKADTIQAAVELQTVSVRQSLAMESLASIATDRDALLELLR
jgi:flagellin-like hook-associated protein FlgL